MPYSQSCFRTIVTLKDILRSRKHDQQQHLSQVLEARPTTYTLPFIIPHVHMSFPLNHIFHDHRSYSMKFKILIMKIKI